MQPQVSPLCGLPRIGNTRTSVSENCMWRKSSCSALVYAALAWLHRTNSPATRMQQPVAPCNKSSQHTLPYTPVAGRIRPIYATHTPLRSEEHTSELQSRQ